MMTEHTGGNHPIDGKVAATLRARRAYLGLSQEAVASKAALSQSQFSKILRGQRPLTVGQLYDICQVLDLSISEVVDQDLST